MKTSERYLHIRERSVKDAAFFSFVCIGLHRLMRERVVSVVFPSF